MPAAGQKWIPAGFHADKANPFKPGLPRTEPFFTFNGQTDGSFTVERRTRADPTQCCRLRFYPPSIEQSPYVYFRARRDQGERPVRVRGDA